MAGRAGTLTNLPLSCPRPHPAGVHGAFGAGAQAPRLLAGPSRPATPQRQSADLPGCPKVRGRAALWCGERRGRDRAAAAAGAMRLVFSRLAGANDARLRSGTAMVLAKRSGAAQGLQARPCPHGM